MHFVYASCGSDCAPTGCCLISGFPWWYTLNSMQLYRNESGWINGSHHWSTSFSPFSLIVFIQVVYYLFSNMQRCSVTQHLIQKYRQCRQARNIQCVCTTLFLWKGNMYYIFWMCVCCRAYPVSRACAPFYIVICDLSACTIFSTLPHKWHNFQKEVVELTFWDVITHKISWKYIQWKPSYSMQMGGWTDIHDEANSCCIQFCEHA